MQMRSPFPIPFGWFQVAWSADVKPGQVLPIEYFDRKLVVWRDDDGATHVNDAFCPHLGAHFGYGGQVQGDDLICPFHGWRFDAQGAKVIFAPGDPVPAHINPDTLPAHAVKRVEES